MPPYTMTHRGLRIWQTHFHTQQLSTDTRGKIRPLRSPVMVWSGLDITWRILKCHVVHDFQHCVLVPLQRVLADVYVRDISTSMSLVPHSSIPATAIPKEIYIRNSRISNIPNSLHRRWGFIVRKPPEGIEMRQCYPKEVWNVKDNILQGKEDDAGPSSWHASLELSLNLATKSGRNARYTLILALGCRHDYGMDQPSAWCHIDNTIWRHNAVNVEEFHRLASSRPPWDKARLSRTYTSTMKDFDFKVFITPARVFSQDMFVVDLHYADRRDAPNPGEHRKHQLLPSSSLSHPGYLIRDAP
jgi:hypothetical protein